VKGKTNHQPTGTNLGAKGQLLSTLKNLLLYSRHELFSLYLSLKDLSIFLLESSGIFYKLRATQYSFISINLPVYLLLSKVSL